MLGFLRKLFRTRDRRHHYRLEQPVLTVTIGGRDYATLNWSLGGLRVGGVRERFDRGQTIEGEIRLPAGGAGSFVAEVVNAGESGRLQLRLLEISPAIFVAMGGLKGG